MISQNDENCNPQILLKKVVNQISIFPEESFSRFHAGIKSSFISDSNECEIFEAMYQEMSIQIKLKS